MKRKTLSLTLALCLVFSLFTWCGLTSTAEDFAPPGSESSIDREPDMRYTQTCYIIPDSVNVAVGQSEYIQTSMGDHQIEHYTFFRWTSSDTSVATVDVYGNVTGVAPGTVTISLAFTSYSHMEYDSCEVHVKPATPAIYLSQGLLTMDIGDTAAFPIEWYYPTNSTLVFSSDNDRIASVNSSTGTITAHGCGLITLNVQISGNSSTVKHLTVRVEPSETETQGINSNSVYMIKDANTNKYLTVNGDGELVLNPDQWDQMYGRLLWFVKWTGNGYRLYSMGQKDLESYGQYETLINVTENEAEVSSEHNANYAKWSIQKYGNYWYLTPVGLAYRDMALCSYGTASTQLKSLDTATNTESRWVFEEIDTSTFNNYWSGSYIGQGETVHIKVELDTDGDDSVFKNDIISEDDFDVLDEWNDISSNVIIYGPNDTVPAGITPFVVTFKGYTPQGTRIIDGKEIDAYKVECGVTNPYIKVLLIDLPISPDNNWDHVVILLNTATDGVLKNDTTLIRKVIIHELGHALKLAHPKDSNYIQTITNGRGAYLNDSCVCAVMNQDDPSDSSILTCATPKWHDKINLINKWGE